MPQLMAEQAPSGAALKVSFPFLSILRLGVSFVVDQFPGTAMSCCQTNSSLVLRESSLQIRRETDIKAVILDRAEQLHVKHLGH
jgi:hypothetical protein